MIEEKEVSQEYTAGWSSNVETEYLGKGLSEETIRLISDKNDEPEWLLEWRLKAFAALQTMKEPNWAEVDYPKIKYDELYYHSRPKKLLNSLDEVDPEILADFAKLGIPLDEQAKLAGVAVDAVYDSVSVTTTYKDILLEDGVIFCSISEAVKDYPDLVKKYLGSVVPQKDNYFSCLNSAVFSDGSFVYIPKGTTCPMELSTYFRINAEHTGQFERTLIIADDDSYVSYLEGCTAPMRDENQLHAAVVELVTLENAEIKYSTVQNWYPGDENGKGGIYNFVTKRAMCRGNNSRVTWTQVETGSAITWKYPSCILKGDGSVGEFYSVAVTKGRQQADTGTKMWHIGKNTKSTIVSKGIGLGHSKNTYRGLVKMGSGADNAKNFTQCDSLMIGGNSISNTIPYTDVSNETAQIEHEASTGKVSEEVLYYLMSRGLDPEQAVSTIVNGFCDSVLNTLPLEFAAEANKLLEVQMEGSIG
jgi:Fe-S cluster assembly protein SufB